MFDNLGTISSVLTVISFIFGLFQTVRIFRIKREHEKRLWTQIAANKAMLRHLAREDVQQAYGLSCELFRDLLREAALLERNYSPKTIELWRQVGKISSDWQEKEALMLLSTREINRGWSSEEVREEIKKRVSDFDNVPPDHPVAKLTADWKQRNQATPPPAQREGQK